MLHEIEPIAYQRCWQAVTEDCRTEVHLRSEAPHRNDMPAPLRYVPKQDMRGPGHRQEVSKKVSKTMTKLQSAGIAVLCGMLASPIHALGQESYHRAKRQQHYSDARHHTKAKIVGGSAVGGAVVGGLLGGGKGALIGAGAGAGGGLIANHAREKHDVRKREEYGTVHPY